MNQLSLFDEPQPPHSQIALTPSGETPRKVKVADLLLKGYRVIRPGHDVKRDQYLIKEATLKSGAVGWIVIDRYASKYIRDCRFVEMLHGGEGIVEG
jgi:hypothetical protein